MPGIAAASNPAQGGGQQPAAPTTEKEVIHAPDASGSRRDDGADLLPQAKITEAEAIAAALDCSLRPARTRSTSSTTGVTLVFNVDVGPHDVKVDATNGAVLAALVDD